MPLVLAAGQIVQVRHQCRFGTQIGLNILHYKVLNVLGGIVTDLQVAAAMFAIGAAKYPSLMTTQSYYQLCGARILGGTPTNVEQIVEGQAAGLDAGDVLPSQTCGLVGWKTDAAGQSFRGRSYLPFPPESANTSGGRPDAGYLTVMAQWAVAVTGQIPVPGTSGASASLEHIIYPGKAPFFNPPVTDYTTPPKWATQRRRGDFGRPNA